MRLTTKIVLAVILSIFLLALGFIVGFSFTDRKNYSYNRSNTISNENKSEIDVPAFKVLRIDYGPDERNEPIMLRGRINIRPAEGRSKLALAEETAGFTSIAADNDTLFIRINRDSIYEKYNNGPHPVINDVDFELSTNTVDIINSLAGIAIDIRDISTQYMMINTAGNIHIESCNAEAVYPSMFYTHKKMEIKNCRIKNLNIDCDRIGSWDVKNSEIEVENLTGSKRSNVQLPKSEARVINWLPKNKDAELILTLYGDTAKVVFP